MSVKGKEDLVVASTTDRRVFFAAVAAHGGARVVSKVASAPLERVKVCLQVAPTGQAAQGGGGRSLAMFCDILVSQGPRALWRGSATHISAACLGGVSRLALLRTSQMWAMPGGDRQYSGLQSYARRCAIFYMAGTAATAIAYPLDTAYTCLTADRASPRRFRGFFHFARTAVRQHGFLSLYRGFPLCLVSAVPFVAIATAVHDVLAPFVLEKRGLAPAADVTAAKPGDLFWLVREGAPTHLFPWNLILGGLAGFAAQCATYPLDTLRRRWQHTVATPLGEPDVPRTLRECALRLRSEGGTRAFYAGVGMNAAKLVPELVVLSGAYLLINASGSFV